MSQKDITPREALTRLGASSAEAIAQVLESFTPGAVERGEVSVLAEGATPFANVPRGAVASSVSYIDGVTGANIFVLTAERRAHPRRRHGRSAPRTTPDDDQQLSEFELSAIAEAANQMMAAAAAAIGVVLGQQIGISPPDTRVLDDPTKADELYGSAPYATSTTFLIGGESCRLIQLVPSAFVVRMARAMDELSAEQRATANDPAPSGNGEQAAPDGQRNGAASASRRRSETPPCECGPSSDARGCRWARRCRCRWARSSTSTAAPTPRSTCSSTACASPRGTWYSPTTASGPCASMRSAGR